MITNYAYYVTMQSKPSWMGSIDSLIEGHFVLLDNTKTENLPF